MPDILTAGFLTALIGGGLAAGVPLIFASLGEIIAEDAGQWYMFRPVWPQTDADRAQARAALAAARRGEDWTKISA